MQLALQLAEHQHILYIGPNTKASDPRGGGVQRKVCRLHHLAPSFIQAACLVAELAG